MGGVGTGADEWDEILIGTEILLLGRTWLVSIRWKG